MADGSVFRPPLQVATANLAWASVAIHQVQVSPGRVGAPGGGLLQAGGLGLPALAVGWGRQGGALASCFLSASSFVSVHSSVLSTLSAWPLLYVFTRIRPALGQ